MLRGTRQGMIQGLRQMAKYANLTNLPLWRSVLRSFPDCFFPREQLYTVNV